LKQDVLAGGVPRLSTAALLAFGAANLPNAALSIAVFVFLPPYFAGHLGVGMAVVGGVWMGVRLFDIPIDILLALAMDRTRTPLGRYRFWLIVGAPILMLALFKLFMAPHGFSGLYLTIWLLVLYLGISATTLAVSAWGATLATHYDERSRLFGVLTALGVGSALTILIIPILGQALGRTNAQSVQAMGWFLIGLTPLAIGVAVVRTPETIPALTSVRQGPALREILAVLGKPEVLRLFLAQMALTLGPGWMSALYLFFFTQARHYSVQDSSLLLALYILAGVPGALGAAALARRIGKHRALMVSAVCFSLGLTSVLIIPKGNVLAAVPAMLWLGAMAASFGLMIQAMLADVGDEVRLDQGKERVSLLYALNGLAQKVAAAFSIGLTFPLLARLGFNPAEGVQNTPQALSNLTLAFIAGPILFVMMGGATVVGWRLDARRQGEIRQALVDRQNAQSRGEGSIPGG
jgi:Na+/melibiose symporter-like transporter